MTRYLAPHALLPEGWAQDVALEVDAAGTIRAVTPGANPGDPVDQRLDGIVVPGMPDLHSHAFQRAMAGLAERAGPDEDSFWTWRETMYAFALRLSPEDLEAIAAQLFMELLKHGYTAVAEFHYVHGAPDGSAYADPAELANRVVAASGATGIGLTLLPVLYQAAGFGGAAARPEQRRFITATDAYLRMVADLAARHRRDPQVRLGIAPHSLRAVTPSVLTEALAAADAMAPVHIHIAEQTAEVEACLAWSGKRPVAWLLDAVPVDRRWCLVHATHMTTEETARLAASGAVAGLCPTTEANLGDGLFALGDYLAAEGRLGIGSDSNVCMDPAEELRLLEYGQRLSRRARNCAADGPGRSTGARLVRAALAGGAQALGRPIGALAPGLRADLVVLDPAHPSLLGRGGDLWLDGWVFAGPGTPVRDVMVGGHWVVREGFHRSEGAIRAAYAAALGRLLAG